MQQPEEAGRRPGAQWFLIPALVYAAAYGAFALVYTLRFGAKLSEVAAIALPAALVAGVLAAIGAIWFAVRAGEGVSALGKLSRGDALAIAVALLLPPVVQLTLGMLPVALSDSWGHLTMINRLALDDATVLQGAHAFNAKFAQTFAPHHAFLAAISRATGVDHLMVWHAFSMPYASVIVLSFYGFLRACLPEQMKHLWVTAVFLAVFILLYPVSETIRGGSDYRIVNSAMFFAAAAIAWRLSDDSRTGLLRRLVVLCGLVALMAATHMIEVLLLMMAFGPFLVLRSALDRSGRLFAAAMLWGTFAVGSVFAFKQLFYSGIPAPLQHDTAYADYVTFHFRQLSSSIGWPIWAFAVLSGPVSLIAYPRAGLFCLCGLIASLALSPLNPLISQWMIAQISTNLVWRTMFVFWVVFAAPLGVLSVVKLSARLRSKPASAVLGGVAALAMAAAAAPQVIKAWGLGGEFSYRGSDAESQLRIWPELFRYLKDRNGDLVLSDMLTSEPIAATTPANVVIHRIWATDPVVFAAGQTVMMQPDTASSCEWIRKVGVTLVLVNRAVLPPQMRANVDVFPLQRDAFYAPDEAFARAGYLKKVAMLDGIDVYTTDPDINCAVAVQ